MWLAFKGEKEKENRTKFSPSPREVCTRDPSPQNARTTPHKHDFQRYLFLYLSLFRVSILPVK